MVPITIILSEWFRRKSSNAYKNVRDKISEVLSDLQESLAGIRIITAHNRRKYNVSKHTNIVGEHKDANLEAVQAASVYTPGTEAIAIIGRALVLIVGGRMVLNGELEIGELTAFLLYLVFFTPIQTLTQLYNGYQQGQAAVAKLRDLLRQYLLFLKIPLRNQFLIFRVKLSLRMSISPTMTKHLFLKISI
ncbi:MAG: hypothetical protein CM15mP49_10030 [Actinomycetota bacterium]|nr:MAG: hypothetical protein CM15mP49_10030 [Actinomycetota bacterium]